MKGTMLRKTLYALTAASAVALAAPATAEPLKVGFVYVSPIGEAGWTWQQDIGRREMQAALGDKVKTQYVEDVPEGADAERVIRDLAQQGNQLIFTTSFGYMNPTIKVAKQFPDVKFVHSTGYKTASNVATTNARFYEARYVAGMLAGKVTQTKVVGYVGAYPIPEVLQGINAFTRGLRSVQPDAQVRVIMVNSWFDPGKERDAALALLDQGADIVTHHTDSTATVQAAEERGKHAIAYHSDMSKFGPKAQLGAVTHHWGPYFTQEVQSVLDGTWKSNQVWGGFKEGMVALEGFGPDVSDEVKAFLKQQQDAIAAGTLNPFAAPIKDNEGKVRLAEGALDDKGLNAMDYYVEGVVGKLGKS
ncbi:BMP family ABC transporter substrate-binding protein [Castellaniella sp. GW247-6E4]|uniref:BMP family ABC transporter substrate-binding protein n=1 Tax=Castellaniella sp. GW247-6E4 TaxID=3140380 RepID=UPI0033157205